MTLTIIHSSLLDLFWVYLLFRALILNWLIFGVAAEWILDSMKGNGRGMNGRGWSTVVFLCFSYLFSCFLQTTITFY